jgi:thiol-disulfide isomerase/thioredoxin
MKTIRKAILLAIIGSLAFAGWAASPTATLLKTRASYTAAVTTGKWQSNFYKAKKYAVDNGLPFIAVWSNGDTCGHCIMFENGCNTSYFKNWMASSGMVFYFTYYGDKGNGTTTKSGSKADDGTEGSNIFHWIRANKNTGYPFVRIYWPKGKVDIATIGDTVDGNKDNTAGAKKSVAYFKSKLKNFKPVAPTPKYTGGVFAAGDTESSRLEAEIGTTTNVVMSLVRTNSLAIATVSTNMVVVTYPGDATSQTNTVNWSAGDAEWRKDIAIPAKMTNVNEKIELLLLDAAGKVVATNHVTMVAAPANSPSNPLWIGEKTADALAWGEWTMDLDVATNKVNAYNSGTGETTSGKGAKLATAASPKDRAYTLVLLEGALWCPDCIKTDEHLIMQDKFKAWAQENKVACVAIDLPYGDATATAPTLLTDVEGTGWLAGKSGAAYLARKMIDKDEAAEILSRNFDIAQQLRLPNWSNPTRPPVPSFFVLRNDGTVAGRIQYFGGVYSPTNAANIDAHIERLNELLRQVDDPVEESNDNSAWTTETIGPRTNVVDKTVSFVDEADVYRLDQNAVNKRIAFTLEGTENVRMQLKVIGGGETVAQAAGKLSDGVSVDAKISSSNYFVSVDYEKAADENNKSLAVDPRFSVDNAGSSLCHYTLKTDFVVEPTELAADNHVVIEDGVNEVTVSLVSNQLYRITNLDEAAAGNLEALLPTNAPGVASGIYLAKETKDVRLSLTAGETEIQKWNPGHVGFAIASASVMESSGSYTLKVVREGGASGNATATLSLDTEKSSAYCDSLVSLPDGFGDELVWEEGETDVKTVNVGILENAFADGDQAIYFSAALGGNASPGVGQFRLSLRDNDKRVPGKIAITATAPAMAKDMTTFARAGEEVSVEMSRVVGTTGDQEVTLAATSGALDETSFTWSNRDAAAQVAKLTLPAAVGNVKVTMTPAKGSSVDGSRRVLTVNVLPAGVPGFEADSAGILANRYIPIDETRIKLDDKATDATTVKKFSGSLPAGVVWTFDKAEKELVVSGTPTKSGLFTAVFRAYTGSTAGLVVAVTVDVTDPATAGGGADGNEPLNAAVATSPTFADVPVFDTTTNRLAGVFTLSLPRTGRASAKYRSVDAGTVSLSSSSWSGIDAAGTLTAELEGKTADGAPCSMTVRALADGKVEVDFADPMAPTHDFNALLPGTTWSKQSPATDFKGYYTVSMPVKAVVSGTPLATGAGYATLKMNTAAAINAGKFAYAGILPDGRAFSGSAVATVTPEDWKVAATASFWSRAVVPVVVVGSLNVFSGAFQITPGAADSLATNMVENGLCTGRCYYKTIRRSVAPAKEADFFWRHVEKAEDASYEASLDAHGTYYVATDSLVACCQSTFQNTSLRFFVQDEGEGDSANWPTNGAPVVTVSYTSKTKTNAIKAGTNKRGLTLSFTPSTGIVSGKFTLDGEKMTYKGVVLPGWGSDSCTACGYSGDYPGGAESQLRPFISGAAWFNDNFDYKDDGGRDRTVSVRCGCPFSIGTQTAK